MASANMIFMIFIEVKFMKRHRVTFCALRFGKLRSKLIRLQFPVSSSGKSFSW